MTTIRTIDGVLLDPRCFNCLEDDTIRTEWTDTVVRYGADAPVDLPVRLPVRVCTKCDERFTDYESELLRDAAVREHLLAEARAGRLGTALATTVGVEVELLLTSRVRQGYLWAPESVPSELTVSADAWAGLPHSLLPPAGDTEQAFQGAVAHGEELESLDWLLYAGQQQAGARGAPERTTERVTVVGRVPGRYVFSLAQRQPWSSSVFTRQLYCLTVQP